jgi:hypothetical protein
VGRVSTSSSAERHHGCGTGPVFALLLYVSLSGPAASIFVARPEVCPLAPRAMQSRERLHARLLQCTQQRADISLRPTRRLRETQPSTISLQGMSWENYHITGSDFVWQAYANHYGSPRSMGFRSLNEHRCPIVGHFNCETHIFLRSTIYL